MKAATRSRWIELVRRRRAARRGLDLLEERRAVLVRALAAARRERDGARRRAAERLAAARTLLARAEAELGREAVEAAALAQARTIRLPRETRRVAGVRVRVFSGGVEPPGLRFSPDGTTETLDRAARAFADALPVLLDLANRELVVEGLAAGLRRTTRRTNALQRVILPAMEREIRGIEETLEEEARDESVRLRRWRAAEPRGAAGGAAPGHPSNERVPLHQGSIE